MSNPKHTPGPWYIEGTSVFTKHRGFYIAETGHPNRSYVKGPAECQANARLIAAAPDCLITLTALIKTLEAYQSEIPTGLGSDLYALIKDANAAISKATGGAE